MWSLGIKVPGEQPSAAATHAKDYYVVGRKSAGSVEICICIPASNDSNESPALPNFSDCERYLIAALWILSAAAWAAIIPIEQSVIAEVAGERAGKGFGLYESSRLAGAGAGALLAGISYESTSWQVACNLFAPVIAAGAIITPWAVQRSGVVNFPRDVVDLEMPPAAHT